MEGSLDLETQQPCLTCKKRKFNSNPAEGCHKRRRDVEEHAPLDRALETSANKDEADHDWDRGEAAMRSESHLRNRTAQGFANAKVVQQRCFLKIRNCKK